MTQLKFENQIKAIVLDIEGTICPISFVHDVLFPYFITKIDPILSNYEYPLVAGAGAGAGAATDHDDDEIYTTLIQFPIEHHTTKESLSAYIHMLVSNDIKDPILKKLQGLVWLHGYETGELSCPIYTDVIKAIPNWHALHIKVYIYSSGSVKAQKLLLRYNDSQIDLNQYVEDYFDTVNIGSKLEAKSYQLIKEKLDTEGEGILFMSDNVHELNAAKTVMETCLVMRPGNKPAEYDTKVMNFDDLI